MNTKKEKKRKKERQKEKMKINERVGYIYKTFLSKFLLLIKVWTLLIYRAFSEINRYNHPYQIISRTVKYQSFVKNIINVLGELYICI